VPKLDKHEEEVMRLMFGLADSIADAPTSEVLEEAEQSHINLLDEADEVRGILRAAGRQYLQRKLRESRQAYETAVTALHAKQYDLPTTATERMELLKVTLRERPDFQQIVMTAQHRNFADLTDEDVTSFLKQLKDLGLLDIPTSPSRK
jgi:protoporphyrinogen oxidase